MTETTNDEKPYVSFEWVVDEATGRYRVSLIFESVADKLHYRKIRIGSTEDIESDRVYAITWCSANPCLEDNLRWTEEYLRSDTTDLVPEHAISAALEFLKQHAPKE